MIKSHWIKQYWASLIPPLLLCIIAFNQLYLTTNYKLTRWKGGGFGMFSEISDRFLHIHIIDRNSFECAEIPESYLYKTDKILKYPSITKIKDLAIQFSEKIGI